MKLTFKYELERLSNTKKEILKELMWHTTKVYNMVLYEIREGQVEIKENNNSMLVSGKELKSENRYLNKEIERLRQIQMCMLKESKKYKDTKRIKKLYEQRII